MFQLLENVSKRVFYFPPLSSTKIGCFVSTIGQIETKVGLKLDVYSSQLYLFGFTEVRTARRVTSLSTVVKDCREIGATAEIQRSQTTSKDR